MKIRNRKYFYYSLPMLIILIFLAFFLFSDNESAISVITPEIVPENYENVINNKEMSFSRITFFHGADLTGSLAIPEHWEGKYRMKEERGVVNFYYINSANNEKMFSVSRHENQDREDIEVTDNDVIKNYDKVVFKISKSDWSKALENDFDYRIMMNERVYVINNFKAF